LDAVKEDPDSDRRDEDEKSYGYRAQSRGPGGEFGAELTKTDDVTSLGSPSHGKRSLREGEEEEGTPTKRQRRVKLAVVEEGEEEEVGALLAPASSLEGAMQEVC
jgi:hypothetical protein